MDLFQNRVFKIEIDLNMSLLGPGGQVEEEESLVHKATKIEMTELKTGKDKTHSFGEIKESISS